MTSSAVDKLDPTLRRRSVGQVEINGPDGRRRTVDLSELNEADRALAEQFGYKPVFKREFGYLSAFSFAVSISGLFSTVATTFSYPLYAGGSSSAIWTWLISGAGCMCIACSVAELVSAYPTSGGLYYTVSRLAPRKWVPSISWLVGWLNLLGQVAGVASSEYGSAQMLLAAVSMNSGVVSNDDGIPVFSYAPTVGITIGVMAALTVLCGLVNSLSTYWMEKVTKSYVIFHVCILVSCCIALLAKTPDNLRHGPKYVFTHVEPDSGWNPAGWSFLFGFLSVSWTMTDYDATAHIAEEISEPEKKAPWAISMAMAFTYVAGWLYTMTLCFVMGEPADLLSSSLAQPVAQIFYNSLGTGGGIFYTVCAFLILQFVCFTAMQSLARTVFAFSRDRLIPFSNLWTKVNRFTGIPLLAVWICVFWCIAINLIGLGSYIAIAGVFNVCAIALDWSYTIPIFCKLLYSKNFQPGPWHMGRFSPYVNAWACIWTLFVSIIFILPTARPVAADNMNYAIAFLGGMFVFAGIYWWSGARKWYTGPITEAEVVDEASLRSSQEGLEKKEKEPESA